MFFTSVQWNEPEQDAGIWNVFRDSSGAWFGSDTRHITFLD